MLKAMTKVTNSFVSEFDFVLVEHRMRNSAERREERRRANRFLGRNASGRRFWREGKDAHTFNPLKRFLLYPSKAAITELNGYRRSSRRSSWAVPPG